MERTILSFLTLYQFGHLKQLSEIYGRDNAIEDDSGVLENITWNTESINSTKKIEIINSLFNYSNVSKAAQLTAHFKFLEEQFIKGKLFFFAKDFQWDLHYCVDDTTGKIFIVSLEEIKRIPIAKDQYSFIIGLTTYMTYCLFYSHLKNNEITTAFRNKTIEEMGGGEYQKYYIGIYPLNNVEYLHPFKLF